MKIPATICISFVLAFSAAAQQPTAAPTPDTNYLRPYFIQKTTLHKMIPTPKNAIVFVGDSITDGNEWSEWPGCERCVNRGISSDISAGVLARLDDILAAKPAKIFLMIGVNDVSRGISPENVITNYREFVRRTKASSPKTKIYLESVLPTNNTFRKFAENIDVNIKILNGAMQKMAEKDSAVTYVDLNTPFSDADGKLNKSLTNDGLHLVGDGYVLWMKILREKGFL